MISFIKNIARFILFATGMYIFLVCIWGEFIPPFFAKNLNTKGSSNGFTYLRLDEVKQTQNVNILFLGSSHAYRGLDPRIFEKQGFKTFNLGTSAQTPVQTEILLKRYIDKLNPAIIIYDVAPSKFASDGVESSLDLIANDKAGMDFIKAGIRQNHVMIYNSIVYGVYRNLFKKKKHMKTHDKEDRYIKGGFVEKEMAFYKKGENVIPQPWIFNAEQFNCFARTVAFIKKRNIRLILVQAPVTNARYNSYTNNAFFDRKMQMHSTYFNFNGMIQLNDTLHFFDDRHLNQKGVEIYNKQLIDTLLFR